MPPSPLVRLRKLCLAMPEAHEKIAWGEPTFRVRNKLFAMYASPGTHHSNGRPAVWIKAAPQEQAIIIAGDPDRFFSPPYVGKSGWIGVWLDHGVDWAEVKALLGDAWLATAPKTLATAREAKRERRKS